MSSKVTRQNKDYRPSWNFSGDLGARGIAHDTLEMLESLRNVAEDIRTELQRLNQLLHCQSFQQIPARLRRISANTYQAKHGKPPRKD